MKVKFDKKEVRDIIISVIVLSIVFSYPEILSSPEFFLTSLFVVGFAFMGHELSHRFVANKLGYFAKYEMWSQGLFFALLFAIFTNGQVIFAAPGAVVFSSLWVFKRPRKEEVGLIGLSGPLFNIIIAFVFALIPMGIFKYAALINAWLAIFNLIPFPPLDGQKIFFWNKKIWFLLITISIGIFLFLNLF